MSMPPATREFPSLKTQVWIQQIQSSRKSQGMLSQKSKELHSHGEGPRGNKFSMCKRRITKPDPGQKPDEIGNINQESVNLGLINVESSSSTFNKIPIWQILEVLTISILLALFYRFLKSIRSINDSNCFLLACFIRLRILIIQEPITFPSI